MRRLIKLALIILVIVLCVRHCGNGKEVIHETKVAVIEITNHTLDKEITTEVSEDPYDKLYGVNQEETSTTLRETLAVSWAEVKESTK
jgi:hypothetical protein